MGSSAESDELPGGAELCWGEWHCRWLERTGYLCTPERFRERPKIELEKNKIRDFERAKASSEANSASSVAS
jgi:hypothetical protein